VFSVRYFRRICTVRSTEKGAKRGVKRKRGANCANCSRRNGVLWARGLLGVALILTDP
jgi:hypothetical protein